MHGMSERRNARRYDLSLPVMIRVPSDEADVRMAGSRKGETLDISTRGMYFTIEQDVQAGSELDITLTLPAEITHGSEVFVKAAGKVVRVDPRSEARNMRLGVAAVIERYDIVRGENSPELN
jgi:c-di-GMP-binding flagellar brake protein YcgR